MKYEDSSWRAMFNTAQSLQIFDIVFSLLGWAKSNTIQVLIRYFAMLVLILCVFPVCGACIWISLVAVALCITEIIRFFFYTGFAKGIAGALRYNVFLVIIPFNQVTEFMTCYEAFRKTDPEIYAVKMPNSWNFEVYPRWLFLVFPCVQISLGTP